jgi:hypothetical protein
MYVILMNSAVLATGTACILAGWLARHGRCLTVGQTANVAADRVPATPLVVEDVDSDDVR